MNSPLLKAEKISKVFTHPTPLQLLYDIDLEIYEGQSVACIGKSGEGKTTLLHILGTLDQPNSGTLYFKDKKVKAAEVDTLRNQHLGFVFQAFHLLSDATVLENLLMPCLIQRLDIGTKSESFARALTLLKKVGLFERQHLSSLKLSGGEKQRLAIARAFMCSPDIILADEPTGNLDHETALDIQQLLLSWVKEERKSLFVVTHSQDLASLCDSCYLLENGRLQKKN